MRIRFPLLYTLLVQRPVRKDELFELECLVSTYRKYDCDNKEQEFHFIRTVKR